MDRLDKSHFVLLRLRVGLARACNYYEATMRELCACIPTYESAESIADW